MTTTPALFRAYLLAQRARNLSTTLLAGSFVAAQITPALATIDNTANAVGTYSGTTSNYGSSTQNVPVAPAAPAMTITKAAGVPTSSGGADATITDAGDTIVYTYTVKNTGNVTMSNVAPVDPGPTFSGSAGTGTMGAFSPATATLAPNATQVFTATYTLSQLDVDRAAGVSSAVSNTATATGKTPGNVVYNSPASLPATTTIAAGPKLTISKVAVLTDTNSNGKADLGEVITYTYTVTNTGNVAMTNVQVNDQHGTPATTVSLGSVAYGADPAGIKSETLVSDGPLAPTVTSTDGTANNGIWSTLQPGAVVKFTFTHTVTQAEIDHG
ncbi:MAG: DUF11 domain-containing protein [Alphaproteobacteria bacterium]|nr:DUF11 domain-containing protein [Alphaproteobacteria bacterium]